MNKFVLRQSLLLLLTATIWGVAFVAQSVGMDYVGPFTFNAVRNLIGGIVLLPCIALFSKERAADADILEQESYAAKKSMDNKTLWKGGTLCGVLLFIASTLQQLGIQYTSVGKAGFITAMYIVLVPVLGIFVHKAVGAKGWLSVGIAVIGLYRLCMNGGDLTIQLGDFLLFLCALGFSFHILVIDHFAPMVDGVKMSCIQFFICSFFSMIGMVIFENPQISQILAAWLPILYAGALSCGVAYTLQIVGQKGMNPTVASLILSLESVISLLAGWVILGQKLTGRELSGCVIVFIAIILVQLPEKKKNL